MDELPTLTDNQLRDLRDLEWALTDTQARFDDVTAALKDAKTDRDAARAAVLNHLHAILNPPPTLPLFDIDQAEADLRAMANPQPTDPV